MNLTALTSADLKQILTLLENKEALQARIATINQALEGYDGGEAPSVAKPSAPQPVASAPVAKPAKPKPVAPAAGTPVRKLRKLKEVITELVMNAGQAGIHVKEIAAAIGVNPQRIYVWFNATGKNVKQLKKVAPATYAWRR